MSRPPYPPEFRRQMVELVRAGRTPEELAKEFEPTAQSIRNWVVQADLDEGRREDGLTSTEKEEPARLRREVRQLREEREILKKAAVSSLGRRIGRDEVPADRRGEDTLRRLPSGPGAGCVAPGLLRLEEPRTLPAGPSG
ncbi:hypothetical protein GCM10023075_50620 [Streptosporangium album]